MRACPASSVLSPALGKADRDPCTKGRPLHRLALVVKSPYPSIPPRPPVCPDKTIGQALPGVNTLFEAKNAQPPD